MRTGCRELGIKDGEAFIPEGGTMTNQYWVCAKGHRWTSGWFAIAPHAYEDVLELASHLMHKHSLMVSVHATGDSMRALHRKEHHAR